MGERRGRICDLSLCRAVPVMQAGAGSRTGSRMSRVCLGRSSVLARALRGCVSGLKRCLVTLPSQKRT